MCHMAFLYNLSGKKQDNYFNADHDDDMAQFQRGGAKSRFSDRGVPVTLPPMDKMT